MDAGDDLGFGALSEMLFVAPGDDPDAAVGEYRLNHPLPIEVQQEFLSPPPVEDAPADAEVPVQADRSKPEEIDEKATARKAHKDKKRNYVIGGAIYVAVMIVVVVLLMNLKKDGGVETRRVEGRASLRDRQNAEAIQAPDRKSGG